MSRAPDPASGTPALAVDPLPVEVIRSSRRKKTVEARLRHGRIELLVPASLDDEAVEHYRRTLVPKVERQRRAEHIDLVERAERLARRYDLPRPDEIVWVGNQNQRWGSCTMAHGRIRISDRLAAVPEFVLDYVVLHELTHLVEHDHGPRFRRLMDRFPAGDRAEGYLMALSHHDLV